MLRLPVHMIDADVTLLRDTVLPLSVDDLMTELISATPWRQDMIEIFGRQVQQPRLHAWYGDADAVYTYSGLRNTPLPWTPILTSLRDCAERLSGARFNSVLLNLYRDNQDSMGMHADDEPELGAKPVIASLSLGATRAFIMKHRNQWALPKVRIQLQSGDWLIMRGPTQQYWKHGINRQTRPCGARLNLTFRQIIGDDPVFV